MRRLLAVACAAFVGVACGGGSDHPKSVGAALQALPNMVNFEGQPYGVGDESRWPGGKPTRCDALRRNTSVICGSSGT
jgi:hypothetical protein